MKNNILIVLIISLGFFLRFWGLDQAPISLNWDEASLGYNAYSILKTGKDEWGTTLPAIFPAFGDYKLPGYVYASIIPVSIFGLNVYSVRFVSALSGVLAIIGIYLLANKVFSLSKLNFTHKNFTSSHFAALIIALLPWHLFLSRPALEANLGLTLFIFGLYFLITSLEKTTNLIYSSILFGLSMHTYNSYRVLVPCTAIVFLIFYYKKIKFNSLPFILSVGISFIASIVIFSQIRSGMGLARYQKLKILNPNIVYQLGEKRGSSNLPPLVAKFVYNRPLYFTVSVGKNFLSYFSFNFWNQSKGAQYQFAIPGKSLVTYPILVLLILGIYQQFFISKSKELTFLFTLFLLSPLAASLTSDPPQAIRPSPMIIFISLFSVVGLYFVQNNIKKGKELILCLFLILFSLSSIGYIKNYWSEYLIKYSSSWQFGYQQVFEYIGGNYDKYDSVFVTKKYGEPHIFNLFFNKINPNLLQDQKNTIRYEKSDWLWTDKIDKVYYLNDWQIPSGSVVSSFVLESGGKISSKNSLLVTTPDHVPSNSTILNTIYFLDGKPAFIIVSIP